METQANQEITSQPVQQPLVQPVASTKHNPSILLLLLIFILIGVASYFGYQNWQMKQQVEKLTMRRPLTPTPILTATPSATDPTVNWKTYKNQSIGFQLKYPDNYQLLSESPAITFGFGIGSEKPFPYLTISPTLTDFSTYKTCSTDNAPPCLDNNYGSQTKAIESMTLNAIQAQSIYFMKGTVDSNYRAVQFISPKNLRLEMYISGGGLDRTFSQILSTFKFLETKSVMPECESINLNLKVLTPNNTWKCEVHNFGKDEFGWDGAFTLTSKIFTVEISTAGRGPYCGDGPDPEKLCQESLFYKNGKFGLTTFTYKGEDKELFGGYYIGRKPWISVKYTNMGAQKLTEAQKQELFQLLNSATVIN